MSGRRRWPMHRCRGSPRLPVRADLQPSAPSGRQVEELTARTFFSGTMRTVLLFSLVALPLVAQQAPPAAPRSLFDYDTRLPLNARDSLRERIDGIEVRALSYDSPKGGRVTGLLLLPGTSGKHPAMIVGHGAPGNSGGYATVTTALAMAKSGAVVVVPDAPFARRNADPLSLSPQD